MREFAEDLGATFAWVGVALAIMAVGFVVVDLLTPGDLRRQVGDNINAAIMVGAKAVAIGIIGLGAILSADDSLEDGLLDAVLYSALGIAVSVVVFLIVDHILPARMRELVREPQFTPATCVAVGVELGVALVIAGAIS